MWSIHCVKSVQIRSFFWSVFFCIRTEYGNLRSKSPYSVRIQENTDQKKLCIWSLFMQWSWLQYYSDSLNKNWLKVITVNPSRNVLTFGDSQPVQSLKSVKILTMISGKFFFITTGVVPSAILLLQNKNLWKKLKLALIFKIINFSYLIERLIYDFHYWPLLCRHLEWECWCLEQKQKVAVKLRRQFSHPHSNKLLTVLKDGHVVDSELEQCIEKLGNECKKCKTQKMRNQG